MHSRAQGHTHTPARTHTGKHTDTIPTHAYDANNTQSLQMETSKEHARSGVHGRRKDRHTL
eukprot:1162075-Pelagomonas_calceolata.AAC.24